MTRSAPTQNRRAVDKAGAYGVQSRGALFVERIDGDFFNVMGLPVEQLGLVLARFGVKLL